MWAAVGGAAAGVVGKLVGGGGSKSKSASGTAQQVARASWSDIEKTNKLNRENALWTQRQNQASMDNALAQNRVNYSSPFGSTKWTRKPSSAPTQAAPKLDMSGLTEAINALRSSGGTVGSAKAPRQYSSLADMGRGEYGRILNGGQPGTASIQNGMINITDKPGTVDMSSIADALEGLTGQLGELGSYGAQGAPADEWEMEQSLPPELQAALDQMRGKYSENIAGLQAGYTPRDEAERALVEQLRGKYGSMVGDLESGFNVDNSVMQALKEQLQPGLDQTRNRENARLAAMGLGTGSGAAWGTAQDALNRSANDANQKAVLGGFDAWNQSQANIRNNLGSMRGLEQSFFNDWVSGQNNVRANLGTMAGLESTWRQNMQAQPQFAQADAAQFNPMMVRIEQPENRTWEAGMIDRNQQAVDQAGNASMWNGIGKAAGSIWDKFGSGSGSGGGGGGDSFMGYGDYSSMNDTMFDGASGGATDFTNIGGSYYPAGSWF